VRRRKLIVRAVAYALPVVRADVPGDHRPRDVVVDVTALRPGDLRVGAARKVSVPLLDLAPRTKLSTSTWEAPVLNTDRPSACTNGYRRHTTPRNIIIIRRQTAGVTATTTSVTGAMAFGARHRKRTYLPR
jgi:hypothetical protein